MAQTPPQMGQHHSDLWYLYGNVVYFRQTGTLFNINQIVGNWKVDWFFIKSVINHDFIFLTVKNSFKLSPQFIPVYSFPQYINGKAINIDITNCSNKYISYYSWFSIEKFFLSACGIINKTRRERNKVGKRTPIIE